MDNEPEVTTCYRHPSRPSGVRCQRRSRPICVDCMVSAPVGFQCPECVSTGARQTRQIMFLGEGVPYLTYALVAVNVAVALAGLTTTPGWVQGDLGTIGLHAGLLGGGVALKDHSLSPIGVDYGEWYRVFTGAFIHAGPIHLGFNMLLLWQTGSLLEPSLGRARFAMLFLVSLLGGSFGALLAAPNTITVGASGAVFGLMGALFVAERAGRFPGRRSAVGFLIVINLALSLAIPGISIGGHIGGLLAGSATGWLFHEFERRRLPLVPVAMAFVLAATLFVGSLWAATLWMSPLF